MEDEITVMVEVIGARQHVLFDGLNCGLTNKAKHASGELVSVAERHNCD